MRARARIAVATVLSTGLIAACGGDGSRTTGPSVVFTTPPAATTTTAAAPVSSPATGPVTSPGTGPVTTPTTTTPAPSTSGAPVGDPVVAMRPLAAIDDPVDIAWRKGDNTLFVVTQDGRIIPVRDGKAGVPVLDITNLTSADGERGLLGLAFHPTDPLAYIDYTNNDGDTVIAEYHVGTDGRFDAASRRQVLMIKQPYPNHNGGEVQFGPDGYLYIGMGDGGAGGDPQRRALNVSVLLGKILRIDPRASGAQAYTVPADNPFVNVAGARPEIWSVGLRNPWRFTFDRQTNDLWIADVGQNEWEEIDVAWADQGAGRGVNFGWSAFEGTHRYNEDQPAGGVVMPIHEYPHGDLGCAVSGGVVYRGAAIPALDGWYVYGDYCSGQVRALQIVNRAVAKEITIGTTATVSAVVDGPDGELYVLSISNGVLALRQG